MRLDLRGYVGLVLLLVSSLASADSWAPAEVARYTSANGLARVTITPRPLGGALNYFSDKVDGTEPAGQRVGEDQTQPFAMLMRRDSNGSWDTVWNAPLVNDVAPVDALVTNDGKRLVTFDNWHSMGYGSDVVVIYGQDGKLIRQFALEDFLPEAYIAFLPKSVSSIWWGRDHYLDEQAGDLVLQVRQPGSGAHQPSALVEVRIRLRDGKVLPHEGPAWTGAMAKVRELDEERQKRWRELRTLRAQPLHAPRGDDAEEWRDYLVELRERLTESSGKQHAGRVLPAPGDAEFADQEEWIKGMLDDVGGVRLSFGSHFVFASPSPEALARLLEEQLRSVEPRGMKGIRVTFVGLPEHGDRVKTAAAGSGAEIVLLDIRSAVPGMALRGPIPEWVR
ncbi:hypothetical protein [Novilysobacter spongiicola]|uniref:Uncharacterized protein n=1 Tax=Lysobacter spongiicola DSM 21749 TaxID=1122188 RepID=A0A1T4RJ06_9GAMM|nr:hypothetical protein [Lysobacter spongiicola]SKA15867.1 hypothetical protein SAMN02745674_02197 [Lysobacter spongiicola DSM 21749]